MDQGLDHDKGDDAAVSVTDTRKIWRKPEFSVLNVDDTAAAFLNFPNPDSGIYS